MHAYIKKWVCIASMRDTKEAMASVSHLDYNNAWIAAPLHGSKHLLKFSSYQMGILSTGQNYFEAMSLLFQV